MQVGDIVVVLVPHDAFYSGYAGNPKVVLAKGSIGRVGSTKVPAVRGKGDFTCVDFIVPNVHPGDPDKNAPVWRGKFRDKELRPATDEERQEFDALQVHLQDYPYCHLRNVLCTESH